MSQTLVAFLGAAAGMVVALLDGGRSVRVAAVVAGLVLAAAVGGVGGTPAALVLLGAALATVALAGGAERLGTALAPSTGLDPLVPVVASAAHLFGPRSLRMVGAVLALPGASWLSGNVTVGGAAAASGSVFAAAYLFLVGCLRLLRARALEELAVGAVTIGLAAAAGWLLEAGPGALPEAGAAAALAPLTAAVAGFMTGRHHRVVAPAPAAAR